MEEPVVNEDEWEIVPCEFGENTVDIVHKPCGLVWHVLSDEDPGTVVNKVTHFYLCPAGKEENNG